MKRAVSRRRGILHGRLYLTTSELAVSPLACVPPAMTLGGFVIIGEGGHINDRQLT